MLVREEIFPLKTAVECIQEQLEVVAGNNSETPSTFT